eukprot:2910005-Pleurochrysis_carterae.AAC.2
MHQRELNRRSHGGESVIHVLTTCFIGAQETEGRRVAHENQRAKGGIIKALSSLAFAASHAKLSVSR